MTHITELFGSSYIKWCISTALITPAPWHLEHVVGCVPGLAPRYHSKFDIRRYGDNVVSSLPKMAIQMLNPWHIEGRLMPRHIARCTTASATETTKDIFESRRAFTAPKPSNRPSNPPRSASMNPEFGLWKHVPYWSYAARFCASQDFIASAISLNFHPLRFFVNIWMVFLDNLR